MSKSKTTHLRSLLLLFAAPLLLCGQANATETDLSDNPLSSATTAEVKPNILFTLDDSGSMNWKFMPDAMSSREHLIGFRNNSCNLVYYNPNSRYIVPKTSTGADVNSGAPTTFTAAYDDGFGAYQGFETRTSADSGATWTAWTAAASCTPDTSGSSRRDCRVGLLASAGTTTDLSTGFRAFVDGTIDGNSNTDLIDTAQPAYYWKYNGSTTLAPLTGDCEKVLSPSYTVNNASYSSGVVTFTTSANHNFLVGQTVSVINIRPTGYRGTYVVTAVPTATTFKVNKASNPGSYTNSGTAWNATYYSTITEYCTDNTTTTTTTCAALGKTALWQKVVVSPTSGPATADINGDGAVNASDQDERQNFANWYSYYSKRIYMMKSAAGRAFVGMTDSKRIGFITINPGDPVSSTKFRTVADFDVANKADWFNTLYAQDTGSSTPLRVALSRAGRYYAGKTDYINSGMSGDPVQYSCQQNFTILTTDGYWNGNGGLKLDGATAMDNQDGVIEELDAYRSAGDKYQMSPRPIFDGASTTFTWNTAKLYYQLNNSCFRQEKKLAQEQVRTGQWQQQTSQLQKKAGQLQFQSTIEANTTGQLQWRTSTQKKTGQLQYKSKIQSKTGQLQWTTNQQKKTGQLQYQSKTQSKTGQLQFTTNQQSKTGQLQYSSIYLRNTGQLQQRDSGDFGFSWTPWADVATCNENSSGMNRTECQVTTGTQVMVPSCTASEYSRTGSAGSYSWTGGAAAYDCVSTGTLGAAWANSSTCDESAGVWACRINPAAAWTYVTTYPGTCTPTRSGVAGSYAWTGGASAVDCQTAGSFNPTWTNNSVCTESGITQCRVGTGSWVKAMTCTPSRTGSSGSYAWTGGASAIDCQNTGALDGTWTNVPGTTCTESSDVACQINSATWTYITTYPGTCTPTRSGVAGSYAWTGGASAVDCQTAGSFNTTWASNSVCTESGITQCRVGTGSWVKAMTCTPSRTGSSGSYAWTGGASAIDCQNTGALDGTWTNTTTCNESSDVACQINASFAYVATYPVSCTPTRSGVAGSYAWTGGASAVDCQESGLSGWTTVAGGTTCQASATVECALNGGSWVAAQTCTPNHNRGVPYRLWTARSSTNTETDCRTAGAMSAWASATTCTQGTLTDGTVDCRIDASAVGVPQAQCAAPTRSGSPGAYSYTGGASAYECDTVVTSPFADVAYACTASPTTDASGYTTQCQLASPTAWADTPSCIADATTECRTQDTTGWVASNICLPVVTPDATGQTTQCRDTATTGYKLQSRGQVTSQAYSGPNQTGTALGTATVNPGSWADVIAGACYATAPTVPATATVIGSGPPTPPDNCTSGSQVWPCETYSSGSSGLSANVASATWTPPGPDPTTEPAFATFTTSAPHSFLVGHSLTIAGGTNALYRGNVQVIEVADTTHFKVNMPDNPGATAHTGGTAALYAGSSNSLSDVAQYYYKTDLRNNSLSNCTGSLGNSVCEDNVPSTGSGIEDDRANWQHMTTFTMGLGLAGTVAYSQNYRTDQCAAKTISGATWASNVVTVTTTAAHGFVLNQAVTISGGSVAAYRGQFKVSTIPSTTTFTYALTTNPGGAFGTGTATGCPDFTRLRTGTINWPIPVADSATALDDLWHAAVNGRGQYFSAGDPDTVVSSLSDALAGINARVAAAAAAATSNLEPVAGDNFAYTAKYKTQAWTGDLEAREIDLGTGAVSGTVIWSAQTKLDAMTKNACDNRTIKLFRSGATETVGSPATLTTTNLVNFKWDTYACDAGGAPTGSAVTTLNAAEQANFNAANVALLSQYPNYGTGAGATVDQRTPAAGANLLNFLRGQRGKEGFSSNLPITNTDLNKLYRTREHVLGDIINAQPVFVKGPFAEYDDTGYALYKSTQASRTPIVYSAANDGMLHAFYAGTSIVDTNGGNEAWAFVPSMVLPNLYKLANENYAAGHVYSVDGTPVVGDVYDTPTTSWKTILVSGLNKGGKGYFALDVTNPEIPKALWEFKHDSTNCVTVNSTTKAPAGNEYSDCHLGYTFGNPIISKLSDDRWVVFVTSGYNNVNSPIQAGDGVGYLYVLEALTGKILYKITTGEGTSADPSGLNKISAWSVNPLRNNTAERIYGGDLLGNVWRFDVNDSLNTAGREATRIATVVDPSGVAQPITTRPELAEVAGAPFIYVGTGRYLGQADLSSTQTNTIWALRDALGTTALTNLRNTLRKMVITTQGSGTSAFRTIGCTAACSSADGWFADLPDVSTTSPIKSERVNIDMKLQLGTLVVASNVPESNACNVGGYAWLNYFNNATGQAIANSADSAVGRRLVGAGGSESLAVGLNIVRLPSGKTVVIATTSAAQQLTVEAPFDVAPPTGKRVSWREIVQ